jgi:hypothetical protein
VDINANLRGSVSGGGRAGGGGTTITIGDIHVDARGAANPKAVGQAVSDSVLKRLRAVGAM